MSTNARLVEVSGRLEGLHVQPTNTKPPPNINDRHLKENTSFELNTFSAAIEIDDLPI